MKEVFDMGEAVVRVERMEGVMALEEMYSWVASWSWMTCPNGRMLNGTPAMKTLCS